MRSTSGLLFVFVISLVGAAPALASREPTVLEREQITNSLPPYIRNAPVECVFLKIRISSRDARYASVGVQPLNARRPHSRCLRYAGNGIDILKKQRGRWIRVYSGSVEPPCALGIPRDLMA